MRHKSLPWALSMVLAVIIITQWFALAALDGSIKASRDRVDKLTDQVAKYSASVNATLDEYDKVITEIEQRANMAIESVDSLHEYIKGKSIEIGRGWWSDFPDAEKAE